MDNESRYRVRLEFLKQYLSIGVISLDQFHTKDESNRHLLTTNGFDKPSTTQPNQEPILSPKSPPPIEDPKIDPYPPYPQDPKNYLPEINPPQHLLSPPKIPSLNNVLDIEPPLVIEEICLQPIIPHDEAVTVVVGDVGDKGDGVVVGEVSGEEVSGEDIMLGIVQEEDVALGNKFTKHAKQVLDKNKNLIKNITNSQWCFLPSSSVVWEYKIDHQWVPYNPKEVLDLEDAHVRNVSELPFQEATCMINLIKMKQVRIGNSSEEKEIRRYEKIFESYVLLKKNDTWKRHNWVLSHKDSTYLYKKGYHKEELEIPKKSITEINYLGTFEKKNNVLGIITENGKKYFISVSTEEIARKWISLISNQSTVKIEQEIPNWEKNSEIGKYSLCFPSISTAAFKFNLELASTIACEVIGKFLEKVSDRRMKLYLVDIQESETLEAFRRKKPQDDRFEVRVGNLTKLDPPCWYIVNASNATFEAGGSGTNAAIHKACSGTHAPSLKKLTQNLFGPSAEVAVAYPVDLPSGCPLRDSNNVHTVIHVVGPNMCPKRANCLDGDYHKGAALLRNAYESILNIFVKRSGLEMK